MSTLTTGITLAGMLAAAVTLLVLRSWRDALRLLLEFLTAAALIRLSSARAWDDLALSGAVLVIRVVLSRQLLGLAQPRAGGATPARPPGRSGP